MGVVYQARQVKADRVVALKMVLSGAHAGSDQLSRFRLEAQAAARLQHPHIAQVYEVGEHRGQPFFSLEYVDGGNLAQKVAGVPQPGPWAAALVETLARAMHHAHAAGIVHRDLKPQNVLLTRDGHPKVTDFGIARKLDEDGLTRTGSVLGTPSFMAPEQASGRPGDTGPACDVWALGAVLYYLLTGRPPFQAPTALETVHLVRTREPLPPRRLQPGCPRDLETISLKCLEKAPRKRYGSALALADELRRFLDGRPISARPVTLAERGLKWAWRHPALAALAGVSTAALAGLAVGLVLWHEADLRGALAEAREQQRLTAARLDAQELLLAAEEELRRDRQEGPDGKRLADAGARARQALARLGDEPGLDDLRGRADRLAGEVERRGNAQQAYGRLLRERDEALFQLYSRGFTGLGLAESLSRAREHARAALAGFDVPDDPDRSLVLDDLYSPAQKAEITRGCFEALLIQAEALTRPLPGQAEDEGRVRAREGLRLLDRADALVGDTRAVHRRRARCRARLGDEAGAAAQRRLGDAERPAAPDRPSAALDYFLVGCDRWFEDGDVKGAAADFDQALLLRPDLFWAQFFRALAYQQMQNPAEARAGLTVCVGQRPDFVWSYLVRGFLQGELAATLPDPTDRAGAFRAAEADFDRAEQLDADESARYVLRVNRGLLRRRQKRYEDAAAELREAVRLRPDRYHAYAELAQLCLEQHRPDAAVQELDRAVRRSPDTPALYRARAWAQLARQDLQAALNDLDEAVRREPPGARTADVAEDHLERALILYRGGQDAAAVEACDQALGVRADLVVAYRIKGLALLRLRRPDEAAAALDRYVEQHGKPVPDVFRSRALAHAALGQNAAAVEDYTQALALKPKDAALRAARGWAYLANDAPKLALPDFDEAVRLDPADGDAWNGRGLARLRAEPDRQAVAAAVADADEAVARGKRGARLLFNAARVYALAAGRLDAETARPGTRTRETRAAYQAQALTRLRECLELVPGPEQAAFWRDNVQGDPALNPVRQDEGFARLAAEATRPPK
jgi:tetratricopeptide (TPR) repeat protein